MLIGFFELVIIFKSWYKMILYLYTFKVVTAFSYNFNEEKPKIKQHMGSFNLFMT